MVVDYPTHMRVALVDMVGDSAVEVAKPCYIQRSSVE